MNKSDLQTLKVKSFFYLTAPFLSLLLILTAQSYAGVDKPESDINSSTKSPKKYSTVSDDKNSSEFSKEIAATEPFKGSYTFQKQDASFGLGFNYFDSFGFQGRYAHILLDNRKFIGEFNNALFFEGGIGGTFYGTYKHYGSVTGLHLLATLRWDAQHSERWTLFGTIGFGLNFITASGVPSREVRGGGLFPAFGVGTMYSFDPDKKWAVRFDLSWQFLGLGISYRF